MAGVPNSLFTSALDQLCTQWLKKTDPANEVAMRLILAKLMLDAAESLMISPKTTFRVYGENVVAAVLIDFFGVAGFERLLDEGAIDFILWSQVVTHMVDDVPGLHPLQAGALNSAPHCQPDASAELGLNWSKRVNGVDAKRLATKIAARTRLPPEGVANATVGEVHRAYQQGGLAAHGFDPAATDLTSVPKLQRERLGKLAEDTLVAAVLYHDEIDLYAEEHIWHAMSTMVKHLEHQSGTFKTVESILQLERMPAIQELLLRRTVSFEDIVKLRMRPETEEFRQWLWKQDDPADTAGVTDRYLALMTPKSEGSRPELRKAARITLTSVAGGVLGTLAGGPVGGALGTVVGTAVGTGVSLFDGFAEKLFGKRNPRLFATNVLAPAVAQAGKADNPAAPEQSKRGP